MRLRIGFNHAVVQIYGSLNNFSMSLRVISAKGRNDRDARSGVPAVSPFNP